MPARILVADDDTAIRNLLAIGLRRAGCVVDFAKNGAEAIDCLAANDYAVVLLDGMMPVLSGFDVVDRVATFERKPAVLLLTAMGDVPIPRLDCSIVMGIITKPFDLMDVVDLVSEMAAARQRSEEEAERRAQAIRQLPSSA